MTTASPVLNLACRRPPAFPGRGAGARRRNSGGGDGTAKSRQPHYRSSRRHRHPITSSSPTAEPSAALPQVGLESPPRWPLVHARAVAAIVDCILNRRDAQKVVGPYRYTRSSPFYQASPLAVAGDAAMGSNLVVAGAAAMSTTLSVTGATALSGTLAVTGANTSSNAF